MNESTHSLLGAYAVNAVSPEDRSAFESHLTICEDCAADLASLARVREALADAQAVAPPVHLRASVMEQIRRTPQMTPHARQAASVPAEDAEDAIAAVRDLTPPSQAPRRWWPRLAVAAASALLLATAAISLLNERESQQQQLALEREVMMVTSAPDAYSMDLALGASHVVMSSQMEAVVAMGKDVPMPAEGMAYQLWLVMDDGTPMPASTFVPQDGSFTAMIHTDMVDVSAIAVSVEPEGGSDVVTGDLVCVTEL
jgi:anti-sigma-K factor RskA